MCCLKAVLEINLFNRNITLPAMCPHTPNGPETESLTLFECECESGLVCLSRLMNTGRGSSPRDPQDVRVCGWIIGALGVLYYKQ